MNSGNSPGSTLQVGRLMRILALLSIVAASELLSLFCEEYKKNTSQWVWSVWQTQQ